MGTYIIRRLLTAIPTLIAISIIIFAILKLAPGDPMAQFAANPAVPPEVRQNIRKQLGLDDPLPVQYSKWARSWVKGDWGFSFASRIGVRQLVAGRIGTTLYVLGLAYVVALLIAIPIGILSAIKQYSIFDQVATTVAFFGFSIPTFFSGLLFILLFSIKLGWLPFIYENKGNSPWRFLQWGQFKYALMPILVLGFFQGARLMRYVRASMLENMRLDYVRTARAKGLGARSIFLRHILRNSSMSTVTILAVNLAFLVGGTTIIETIFAVPGIGQLIVKAIFDRDYPIIQGITLAIGVLVLFINLLTDLSYAVLDPRVAY